MSLLSRNAKVVACAPGRPMFLRPDLLERPGHGVSLLRWRGGGVEYPHDTPSYPFMPSPTFAHSSERDNQTASARLPPLAQTDEETRWMTNKSSKMRSAARPRLA